MLAGLRHDRVVGGDDEHDEVDAGGAGEHVLDEAFVARDIDDAEAVSLTPVAYAPGSPGWQFERGEADVDGDAARFFFGQAVAVDAGEGLDERGLAVIDMASGAEDEIARLGISAFSV